MLYGVPVVASDMDYAKVIKEVGCGYLVDYYDIENISSRIHYLLDNPDYAKLLGEKGKKAVLEFYKWENEKSKLEKILKDIFYK